MKLSKDFGVRALLALIAALGYYIPLIYVVTRFSLAAETMLAILGAASAPWLLAMGFYFGSHIAGKENPPGPEAPTPSKT